MHIAYITVTVILAVMLVFSSLAMLLHNSGIMNAMRRAGVPESWLPMLATLKAAGAVGLILGLVIPLLGLAAATGVVLFFVGAIITHLRARWGVYAPMPFFLMAVGALALRAIAL